MKSGKAQLREIPGDPTNEITDRISIVALVTELVRVGYQSGDHRLLVDR